MSDWNSYSTVHEIIVFDDFFAAANMKIETFSFFEAAAKNLGDFASSPLCTLNKCRGMHYPRIAFLLFSHLKFNHS